MSVRVKVTGDYFHGRVPQGAVYVGRGAPGLPGSEWRNRFPAADYGLDEALRLYEESLAGREQAIRAELAGRDLACWCPLDQRCHADVLLRIANVTDCLHYVHREIRDLFTAAGCRTLEDRQALAEELVGPGPHTLAQGQLLLQRLRMAVDEPHDEPPPAGEW